MTTTAEYRAERLTKLEKAGYIGIPDSIRSEIIAIVQRGWIILGETYNGWRLTLDVNPDTRVYNSTRRDLENDLLNYGNTPHLIATEFTGYSMSFIANK